MRILLFIRRMDTGGAERQFAQMAHGLHELGHGVCLATLYEGGDLEGDVRPGVERASLFPYRANRMRGAFNRLNAPRALRSLVQRFAADVVYSALYASNTIAHRAVSGGGPPLAWGFRIAHQKLDWKRRIDFEYGRRHSDSLPLAIFNSHASVDYHAQSGFRFARTRVIPNGIDASRYRPDADAGSTWRGAHGIPPGAFLVGSAGRLVDQKDPEAFLEAAALLAAQSEHAHFAWVGSGSALRDEALRRRAQALGLEGRFVLAGHEPDMPAFYSALDLYVSTSTGEGFSNAVAEAMACERTCVVTDVGDSARVVGEYGWSVPCGDARLLFEAWQRAARLTVAQRADLGQRARARIEDCFTPEVCARETAASLAELTQGAS